MRSVITTGSVLLALVGLLNAEVSPAEVDLFRRPRVSQLQASPDGRWIGGVVSSPTPGWACWSVHQPDAPPRIAPGRISEFAWWGSNSVVWVDSSQHPPVWRRLHDPFADATAWNPHGKVDWVRILRPSPSLPDAILLEGYPDLRAGGPFSSKGLEVYLVPISSAEPKRLTRNPGRVIQWMADGDGQVRLGLEVHGSRQRALGFPEGAPLRGRVRLDLDLIHDTPRWLGVSADGTRAWFAARMGRNTRGVHEWLLEGDAPPRLLASNPDHDFDGRVIVDGNTLVALVGEETVPTTRWMDSRWEKVPEGTGFPVVLFNGGELGLFWRPGPEGAGEAWIVPRSDSDRLPIRLAPVAPSSAVDASPTRPVAGQSRDGLRWTGYLSMPRPTDRTPPPLAVLVHGGPWTRDYASNPPEADFLVRRGWAVLRVNYRGSDGFGRRHQELGAGHWRHAAQDLIDATRQMMDSKVVDPDRVVICGASFGGFLAALALTEPDTPFQAAACLNAVFDLDAWLRQPPQESGPHRRKAYRSLLRGEQRPDPGSMTIDAQRIHQPLWLGHAVDDRQVPVEQSRKFARDLHRLDRPVRLTLWDSGGHLLGTPENRADRWDQAERFLGQEVSR